ncbi:MAG: type IV pilus secretin PilQ [Rickettsiales bacterium]|nr:type IV pilus secretin PilQ [Rickettsiales bacterium]
MNSCNKGSQLAPNENELIEKKQTFNKEKFVEQSKERSVADYVLGPKIDNNYKLEKRENYRKLINQEENFDYVDIPELEKNNFKISINTENTDIRTFAEMVSKISGMNILVSDEVTGNVNAKLKDVLWASMLDSVLKTKKLEKYVDTKSNIIRIHDQSTVVQLEEFDQKRKENVQRALLLKKASQPLITEIFKLFYTKPAQVKTTIDQVLKTQGLRLDSVRNIDPEITIDERKNLLIVKSRKEDMKIISDLISELDTRTQQVYIEAFIVEISDDFDRVFGSRFGVSGNNLFGKNVSSTGVTGATAPTTQTLGAIDGSVSNLPVASPTGALGVLTGIGSSADLKLELSALERQGLTKVVSNPKIFTLDNQEAVIFQGNEVPFETVSQDGTQIQFKEAGLKLAVTPSIVGDGNLMLNLAVNKDSADLTLENPPISKSEIRTNLVTKDGEIVVMGGIYTESKITARDKVPGLGDVPMFGRAFRRDSRDDGRKELIIFIAPKVL